jgi:STE24 endopeptidase
MIRRIVLVAALAFCGLAAAQPAAPQPSSPREKEKISAYSLPPEKLAKAIDYARARNVLHFAGVAYGVIVMLAILVFHVAPRFRDWAERLTRRRIVQAYIFAPLLLLTLDILDLPLGLYGQHLARKYDQSVQGWGSWFWDWAKGELIQFLIAGFMIWILYAVIRRSPQRWWFYFWLVSIPIVIFLLFITPVLIEPLFFKFEPLAGKQPALVAEIQKVVARGGLEIPPDRMFEMKASEKLNSLNAYVAGIGASKRVVVWDTTIQKMTPGQILFVFGHEMGHYVLQHIWIGIGMSILVICLFLFLGYHSMHWALSRWGARWGIRGIEDWASLPVLILAISLFGFVAEPIFNSFGRVLEHNADIYGLEVIHGIVPDSPQAAAAAFQILGEVGLSDPNPSPFIEFWRYDHPSIGSRVRFSAEYDPWSKGEPRKYVQ